MLLTCPKTKKQYCVTFDEEQYPHQCGISIIAALQIYEGTTVHGKYLKNYPAEAKVAYKLLEKALFLNDTTLYKASDGNMLFRDYSDKPICARVVLSDVIKGLGPYMTGEFAEYLKLPHGDPICNPNTRHMINHWWYDMPVKDEYDCDSDEYDGDDYY